MTPRVLAASGLALLAGCSLLAPGSQGPRVEDGPGMMTVSVVVNVKEPPSAYRGIQFNGIVSGALQNDIAHLVVGLFDYGTTTLPSFGYLYTGAVSAQTAGALGATEAAADGAAAYMTVGTGPIKDKIGTVNCIGCDFSAVPATSANADRRRYLIRDYGTGSGWINATTAAKFTNIPIADTGGLHKYVVFAAAYDAHSPGGSDTPSLLGYSETKAFDGTNELPSSTGSDFALTGTLALDLKLNQGLLQSNKAMTEAPTLSILVPAATGSTATPKPGVSQTYVSSGAGNPRTVAVDPSGNIWHNAQQNVLKRTTTGSIIDVFGTGSAGFVDTASGSPQFDSPRGIAFDSSGNTFVADCGNHAIRKIATNGTVTTVAGSGPLAGGWIDSASGSPKLNCPSGIVVAADGTMYVAEYSGSVIRKVTASGTVSTVAGSGANGYVEGTGTTAYFRQPEGLALDAAGTKLYVADGANHRIRTVTIATGATALYAGTGAASDSDNTVGTSAEIKSPLGLAIDSSGYVYVGQYDSCRIRTVSPLGTHAVTTLAGNVSCGDQDGALLGGALFGRLTGIGLSPGLLLYFCDFDAWKIRVLDLTAQ